MNLRKHLLVLGLIIFASATSDFVTPVLLYSEKLSAGLLHYQDEYDVNGQLSQEAFLGVAREMIGKCQSDAYVFVNVPGLIASDFVDYRNEMMALARYVKLSSTALRFETVTLPEEESDLIENFAQMASGICGIEDLINLNHEDIEGWTAYVDSRPRIITINLAELPANSTSDNATRREIIEENDKNLREVLAQIPSPSHTVIVTSTVGKRLLKKQDGVHARIFDDIFEDASKQDDVERNNRVLPIEPYFGQTRPKFEEPSSPFLGVFDKQFYQEYKSTVDLIIMATLGFCSLQILLWYQSAHIGGPQPAKKQSKNAYQESLQKGPSTKKSEVTAKLTSVIQQRQVTVLAGKQNPEHHLEPISEQS
ncbi:LAMI_0E13102g1_1 [Lachancea mirantina]|uniref:Protein BIG1 n=1 Tax=Lachancea mirantina TaxID=1230905 RepID=A0A1G4JQK9_9SACH|nr:LAMI_0E13102g1_1 [Lachancea mirantina]